MTHCKRPWAATAQRTPLVSKGSLLHRCDDNSPYLHILASHVHITGAIQIDSDGQTDMLCVSSLNSRHVKPQLECYCMSSISCACTSRDLCYVKTPCTALAHCGFKPSLLLGLRGASVRETRGQVASMVNPLAANKAMCLQRISILYSMRAISSFLNRSSCQMQKL